MSEISKPNKKAKLAMDAFGLWAGAKEETMLGRSSCTCVTLDKPEFDEEVTCTIGEREKIKQIANDPEIEQILDERKPTKREKTMDIVVYACVIAIVVVAVVVALLVFL